MSDGANKVQEIQRVALLKKNSSEFLRLLHSPDDVYEIRVLDCPSKRGGDYRTTHAGWFNDATKAGEAIAKTEQVQPPAFYVSLNPCNPALLSRRYNALGPQRETTRDVDIVRRTNIIVDIDPKRLAKISSTDAEMTAAIEKANEVKAWLTDQGWPDPMLGMSGNGGYLIYHVDLPNDADSTELVKSWIRSIAERFSDDQVDIDCSTFNAAQLIKVLGTKARKGTEYPGTDRPHRTSYFEPQAAPLQIVSRVLLESVANLNAASDSTKSIGTMTTAPEKPQGESASDSYRRLPKSAIPRIRDRARKYLEKIPSAIAGQGGSDHTMEAACNLFRFALDDESAWILLTEYNARCEPEWSISELDHKLHDARKKVIAKGEWGKKLSAEDWLDKPDDRADESTELTFVRAGSILTQLITDLRTGNTTQLTDMGPELRGMEVAPGLITIIGAGPGAGKTALVMQSTFAALERDESLRAVIANAEMEFSVLLRRELTRTTAISSDKIRFGNLTEQELATITMASCDLIPRLDRVTAMTDKFSLVGLEMLCSKPPGILVVDYLQKFAPHDVEPRIGVGQVMQLLRKLAKLRWAVIAISATSRPVKGAKLTMNSLRESSEIEYNADSIYLMNDNGPTDGLEYVRQITLNHAKNRHGSQVDIRLEFNKPRMKFSPAMSQQSSDLADDFGGFGADDPFADGDS